MSETPAASSGHRLGESYCITASPKSGFIDAVPLITIGLRLHATFRAEDETIFEFLTKAKHSK